MIDVPGRPAPPPTLGAILAGGASRRFGRPKATAALLGKTLIERVAGRAAPQVDALVISGGGEGIPSAPYPAVADQQPGEGPFAGVLAALARARALGYPQLATFPCDAPFFPHDLVERLRAGLGDAAFAVAATGAQEHRTFALWRTAALEALERAFAAGVRSLGDAANAAPRALVPFPENVRAPRGDAFFNINRERDLAEAEAWLRAHGER